MVTKIYLIASAHTAEDRTRTQKEMDVSKYKGGAIKKEMQVAEGSKRLTQAHSPLLFT